MGWLTLPPLLLPGRVVGDGALGHSGGQPGEGEPRRLVEEGLNPLLEVKLAEQVVLLKDVVGELVQGVLPLELEGVGVGVAGRERPDHHGVAGGDRQDVDQGEIPLLLDPAEPIGYLSCKKSTRRLQRKKSQHGAY